MKHFFARPGQMAAIFILLFLFSTPGCKTKSQPKALEIHRADQLLQSVAANDAQAFMDSLNRWDPLFADVYANQILRTQDQQAASPAQVVDAFCKEMGVKALVDTTLVCFPDLQQEAAAFALAFQEAKTIYPDKPVPRIFACITAMSLAAFTVGDSILAFSTDLFLGSDFPGYEGLYPRYVSRTFTRQHIVPKAVTAWIQNSAGTKPDGGTLLDQMLYHGKVLAAVKRMLPETADSLILEYTGAQTDWVKDNELQIWSHLAKENLLYKTDLSEINKLVNPSPNAPGMPPEAPGRTANFIGWKIVEAYLKKNPATTFEALFQDRDSQNFLQNSGYKPPR